MDFSDLRIRYQMIDKMLNKDKTLLSEKERKEYFRIIPRYLKQLNELEKEYDEVFEKALAEDDDELEEDPRIDAQFSSIQEGYNALKLSIEDMEAVVSHAIKAKKLHQSSKEKTEKPTQTLKEEVSPQKSLWEALDDLEGMFKEFENFALKNAQKSHRKEKSEFKENSIHQIDALEYSDLSDDDFDYRKISPTSPSSSTKEALTKKPILKRHKTI